MASGLKFLSHCGRNVGVDSQISARNIRDGVSQVAQNEAGRSGSLVWRQSEVDEVQDGLQHCLRDSPTTGRARGKVRLVEPKDNNRAHYKARRRTHLYINGIIRIQAGVA